MKNLFKTFAILLAITVSQPAEAGGIWPFKKSTGLSVAKHNQKKSVKYSKQTTKGFKKASKAVNARLSQNGG